MVRKKKGKQTAIENSLLEQLALLGAMKEHYIDLIRDYMGMWRAKTALFADIKVRGITYRDVSSTGVEMQKNNPSVKELVMINRQMLSILKELGLSTSNVGGGEVDEL